MPKVFISHLADEQLKSYLKAQGYTLCVIDADGNIHADGANDLKFVGTSVHSALAGSPIAAHPDIYMCRLKDRIWFGDKALLKAEYPGDVLYNAAAVGKYLLCSKYTSSRLIEQSGLIPLIVSQGYVKCNCVVVDDRHIITEDRGIADAINRHNNALRNKKSECETAEGACGECMIECLLINPKEVKLPGYPHGFIGGASGRIKNTIVFNGNIRAHSSYKEIESFICALGLDIVSFDYPLTDIGSIIAD